MKDICRIITAACILHNLCINNNEPDFDIVENQARPNEVNEIEDIIRESIRTRRDELNRWFIR